MIKLKMVDFDAFGGKKLTASAFITVIYAVELSTHFAVVL